MRIALFTETYIPLINGVVTHVKTLRDGLIAMGHEVLVVTASAKTKRHYVSDGVLHCPAITSKKFYNYGLATPLSLTRLTLIKKFKPDICHIHTEFGIGLSGIAVAKYLDIPIVYTLHTMYDDYIYYIAKQPFIKSTTRIAHKYSKMVASSADSLTGPSKKCEEYFRKVGIDKKVHVINNAAELDIFNVANISIEDKKAFRERFNLHHNTMIACFCGRLGKEKSVDVLLNCMQTAITPEDDIKLIIIGDGPCKQELEELAQSLNITDRVIFTGRVEHDELPPYYAACDVYVTASTSDTNSISMLEAMATGLPTLQITDPLNADQVVEDVNGYVFSNAQEFRQKLKKIKNMSSYDLINLKQRAIESTKKHSSQALADNVFKVYLEAIYLHTTKKTIK